MVRRRPRDGARYLESADAIVFPAGVPTVALLVDAQARLDSFHDESLGIVVEDQRVRDVDELVGAL